MPFIYKETGEIEEIPSVREYLLNQASILYTTMRMLKNSGGKVVELETHFERVKANDQEKQEIEKMLKGLSDNKDLRITLMRRTLENKSDSRFEIIYEEMPRIEIESCQIEIRKAKRSNVQEKSSQWIK